SVDIRTARPSDRLDAGFYASLPRPPDERRNHQTADRTGPSRRNGTGGGRGPRACRGPRSQRGVPRQAAAGQAPAGLRHPGRAHGRRDPRAGPAHADPRGSGRLTMQKIVVGGGVPLRGEVRISGAKNAVLPILCAGLLGDAPLVVRNVPNLHDVKTTLRLLAELGAGITLDDSFTIRIDPTRVRNHVAPYELVKTMRASVLVLGPLLARHGAAEVSLPGGCAIGSRPVDQHIKGMQALGAEVAVEHGFIKARARRLRGARVVFDMVSVGATENVLM